MKTTLSFTALALLATALLAPMNANAADRQITVDKKKFQTFTVQRDEAPAVDVADANPAEKPIRVSPKAFRVDEAPVQVSNEGAGAKPKKQRPAKFKVEDSFAVEEASIDTPKLQPRKQKQLRFKVEDRPAVIEEASIDTSKFTPKPKQNQKFKFEVKDEDEQAAVETPALDDENEVAATETDRPANLLNEKVKLVKKVRPAPVEAEEEATTEDTDNSADIAADTSEEEAVETPVKRKSPRLYYYASKQNSYEAHENYDFEAPAYNNVTVEDSYGDTGSSCNQNLSY